MKSNLKAAVIGGGYTGLAATIKLIDKGYSVILIEKSSSLGGLGNTITLSNGSSCESFYHHFFTHDKVLLQYLKRFLNTKPTFRETKMAIFYKGNHYSWNGLFDLIKYPHINFLGKLRFLLATIFLSKKLLNSSFLDKNPLSKGLERLYGVSSYKSVWEPMIKGKFGNKADSIPLRWMEGRLKQRIESRKAGKEKLGFLKGSLDRLTKKLKSYILTKESTIIENADILKIIQICDRNQFELKIKKDTNIKKYTVDKLVFTTPSNIANKLIKNIDTKKLAWKEHKYFTAYCLVIELSESLSDYYWTNIADNDLFFCGYIEQTKLTKCAEYGGLNIAYLTKYTYLENDIILPNEDLKLKGITTLKKLFPKKNIDKIIKNIYVSISKNAQVLTDFEFQKTNTALMKKINIYLGNMSNVYPDERSINNAIKVGEELIENIRN